MFPGLKGALLPLLDGMIVLTRGIELLQRLIVTLHNLQGKGAVSETGEVILCPLKLPRQPNGLRE